MSWFSSLLSEYNILYHNNNYIIIIIISDFKRVTTKNIPSEPSFAQASPLKRDNTGGCFRNVIVFFFLLQNEEGVNTIIDNTDSVVRKLQTQDCNILQTNNAVKFTKTNLGKRKLNYVF